MKIRLLAICILISGFGFQSMAQGDLLVTPTRVVFEGKKQKEALNLVNTGKDTATYSISFINYNMNEDGSFESIEKPDSGQMFATPYLRIFPRRVSLAPGEPQVIMLQYRRRADMVAGEYRSHLYFRAEKQVNPLGTENKDTSNLNIQLIPVYGMSIPVIIRSGIVDVGSSLSNLSIGTQPNLEQYLKLTINRTGNISIYGDIVIEFIPTQGKSMVIGGVKGVGVYTNINKRNIAVKLNNTTGKPFSNGKLKVQFISKGEAKRTVYAESELNL
ncbi:MAG: hypothetical protein R6U65_04385 [Perlabentimonas sp.]